MTQTGSRDDLSVDASRCLKMRFCESSCRRCVDICPHGAVTLDDGIAILGQCRGCLLCTTACPAGALEQSNDFSAVLAQLCRVPEPVLGCIRTKEHSNATLACLGGLSEEHLLALCHTVSGKLTFNQSLCRDCTNHAIIAQLRQRIEILSKAQLLEGGCNFTIAESAHDISYRDESVDRRSFFKSFRNSLFQSAAVILSGNNEPAERRTEYAAKRLPVKRGLLNRIRNSHVPELKNHLKERFDVCISYSDACTQCQGCVAICPAGALKTEQPDMPPIFDTYLCSGCGLCKEFCLDGAIQIYHVT